MEIYLNNENRVEKIHDKELYYQKLIRIKFIKQICKMSINERIVDNLNDFDYLKIILKIYCYVYFYFIIIEIMIIYYIK